MAIIRNLKNFFTGNIIYPITKTRAVYNDSGVRLDTLLSGMGMNNNLLINSDFSNPINQRGLAELFGGGYFLDRWTMTDIGGEVTRSVYNENGTKGLFLYCSITDGNSHGMMQQRLEFPETYRGKILTLSTELKCVYLNPSSMNVMIEVNGVKKVLGSKDLILDETPEISKYRTYSLTVKVPDVAGITMLAVNIGNGVMNEDGTFNTDVEFDDADIYIKWAKLELGSVATPLVQRLYGEELYLCRRFYEKINSNASFMGGCESDTTCYVTIPFSTPKRIVPTITFKTATNVFLLHLLTSSGGTATFGNTTTPTVLNSSVSDASLSVTHASCAGYVCHTVVNSNSCVEIDSEL